MTVATLETYGSAVSAEVRAMVASRGVKHKRIADALERSEMYVSRRMTGETEWSSETDLKGYWVLDRICEIMDADVECAVPRAPAYPYKD